MAFFFCRLKNRTQILNAWSNNSKHTRKEPQSTGCPVCVLIRQFYMLNYHGVSCIWLVLMHCCSTKRCLQALAWFFLQYYHHPPPDGILGFFVLIDRVWNEDDCFTPIPVRVNLTFQNMNGSTFEWTRQLRHSWLWNVQVRPLLLLDIRVNCPN